MVRSSHPFVRDLPLLSSPPPHLVLCSPPALSLRRIPLSPATAEVGKEYPSSGAAISPHRIYRFTDPKARRAYQYVNESPTGNHRRPTSSSPPPPPPPHSFLSSLGIYRHYIRGDAHKYLACRPHFFRSLTLLENSPSSRSLRLQPPPE